MRQQRQYPLLLLFLLSHYTSNAFPYSGKLKSKRKPLNPSKFQPPSLLMKNADQKDMKDKKKNLSEYPSPEISREKGKEVMKNAQPIWNSIQKQNKNNKIITAAFALLLFAMAAMAPLQEALAASTGGRMGGSFSRSSYSAPRSRSSYRSTPSYRSYSSPRSSVSYYSSPRIFSPITPFFNPYYRYGSSGVITVARGPSFFDTLFFGGLLYFAFNSFAKSSTSTTWRDTASSTSALGDGFSVVQLSVALNVPKRNSPSSILSKLNSLANTARTDTRVGVQSLLAEVSLELMRQKDSIVAASSSYQHFRDYNKAQREYNSIAVSERSKFERETLNKYQGVNYSSEGNRNLIKSDSSGNLDATVAVVTLVLCIEGDSTKIPSTINSVSELQQALSRISSDSRVESCLQSAEILWTPQDDSDNMSLRDVISDYPKLRTL